jgi:hypothetical protein
VSWVPLTYALEVPYEYTVRQVSQEEAKAQPPTFRLRDDLSECISFQGYSGGGLDETFYDRPVPAPIDQREGISENVNSERLSLLAEKYVGGHWSPEMEARLQIDHQKIVELIPRVEPEQIAKVKEVQQALKTCGDELERMLDELGIK